MNNAEIKREGSDFFITVNGEQTFVAWMFKTNGLIFRCPEQRIYNFFAKHFGELPDTKGNKT